MQRSRTMGNKNVEEVKAEQPAIKELLEKDYAAEVTKAQTPVVLDFYSSDSAPCTALAPRLGAVAEKFAGKIQFLKVQRQANPKLSEQLGVTASPTLIFFKAGVEFGERLTGDDIKRT